MRLRLPFSKLSSEALQNLLRMDDEGIEEKPSKVDLSSVVGFSIQMKTGLAQVLMAGTDPEDDSQDAQDATDATKLCLYNFEELPGGWVFGKLKHEINGTVVDNPEYIALRHSAVDHLPLTNENYVDAQMDWIAELVFSDFEEKYGDQQTEEFDDGE